MISSSRKKRQTPGTDDCIPAEVCENAPNFEDLNFTDAQRQFCNDIESCLYDLAVTGSEEFAGNSRDFDSNKTETTEILSKSNISTNTLFLFLISRQLSTCFYCQQHF